MSQSPAATPATPLFSIALANFPQQLLISKTKYDFIFNAVNNQQKATKYRVIFKSPHFEIAGHEAWAEGMELAPGETKQFTIKVRPKMDGLARLDIEAFALKQVEYTEMVWKVRQKVEDSLIKKIMGDSLAISGDLRQYRSSIPNQIDATGLTPLNKVLAEEKITALSAQAAQGALTPEQKNVETLNIARAVFMEDPAYAFSLLGTLTDQKAKLTWMLHFIPTGILLDHQITLSQIMDLPESEKPKYFEMMAYGIALLNPQDAVMVALNIENAQKRDGILKDIIFGIADTKPDVASNMVYQIADKSLQTKVLFEVIKRWGQTNREQAVNALQSLIENILSGANTEFIKTCMIFLAYLTSPQSVYDLIGKLDASNKETIQEQLKEYLKVQVQEVRTKLEQTPAGALYYMFPAADKKASVSVDFLSSMFGNLSANLLEGKLGSNLVLLFPYGYQFPIYLGLQQVYLELSAELKRDFGFILFPSKNGPDQVEIQHLQNISKEILANIAGNLPSPINIVLIDLIPYFSKPALFFGDMEMNDPIVARVQQHLGEQASVICNNDFFSRGSLASLLHGILPEPKFKIINMVLSYNFLNQYPLLKALLKGFLT